MTVFDPKSRYTKHATTYTTSDSRGRQVTAVGPASPPSAPTLGDHLRRDGQRLDHLAAHYLDDPNGFWRLAEHNGVLLPDAALTGASVKIPRQS